MRADCSLNFCAKKSLSCLNNDDRSTCVVPTTSSTTVLLRQSLVRGLDQVGKFVLAHQTVFAGVELFEERILLRLVQRITAKHCEANLVEEKLRLIFLQEIITVLIHCHPQLIELGRVHVVGESAEVSKQHGERNLCSSLVLRNLLLSRQGRSSQ